MVATESDGKAEKVTTSVLLTCIGKKDHDVQDAFTFASADNKLQLQPALDKFTEYCEPRMNSMFLRYKFCSSR